MTRWTTHGPDGQSDHQDNDDNFHAEEASPWGDDDEGKITQAQSRSPSSPTLSLLKQWVARLVARQEACLLHGAEESVRAPDAGEGDMSTDPRQHYRRRDECNWAS
jgi:hypothetical protein